jgi:cell division initiation protein
MLKSDDLTPTADAKRLPSPERHMTITPLDMRQPRFSVAMRGFNKVDVTAFLQEAADGFEHALRENERLRQEIARLEGSIVQFRELESSLKNTLVTAQKVADDMHENALQEAARLVREAEGRAELLLQRTQARAEDIEREIDGLWIKRREAETNLESTIAALHNTLDFIREQDRRVERVVPHHPKIGVATMHPA